jgi:hypoxanthine phosphoribosyltransferase
MRILTWTDFDYAVEQIATAFPDAPAVYGFPRGGLCLSVALSHRLGIPHLLDPQPSCLVVDDIYETGKTLATLQHLPGACHAVWMSKAPPTWFYAVEVSRDPTWVLFPWESPTHAQEDHNAYHASR